MANGYRQYDTVADDNGNWVRVDIDYADPMFFLATPRRHRRAFQPVLRPLSVDE